MQEVIDLDREVKGGYDANIFTIFYEYHPQTVLVAEVSGRVAGFIFGFMHSPLQGRIFWLAIRPRFQRRGIGRSLMAAIIRGFRRMGALSVTLEVRIGNRRAQALYASMGFAPETISPAYYSDGEAALIMTHQL
ncbi:MAG: GNAT family N-acetyltransferase [Methanotrichaceae archaeon]|nr:GNAT family N-acetyltransferase [Methanotrichaceae archaeon]